MSGQGWNTGIGDQSGSQRNLAGDTQGHRSYQDDFLKAAYDHASATGDATEVDARELALLLDIGPIARPGQKTAPVVMVGDWVKAILLMLIPIVNLVVMVSWARGGRHNPNLVNLARAVMGCVGAVVGLIALGIWIIYLIGGFPLQ